MKTIIFDITPVGKPRLVKSDIWSGRKCVSDYYRFKDKLVLLARAKRYKIGSTLNIVFQLPMTESWSKKKKKLMLGKPHTQKPDNDNMLKAFQDCLTDDDSGIWKVTMEKRWGETGKIIIKQ
jgi:Holliday junction resolvase RusA-like endonuclease